MTAQSLPHYIKNFPTAVGFILFFSIEIIYSKFDLLAWVLGFIVLFLLLVSFIYFRIVEKGSIWSFFTSPSLRGAIFLIFPVIGQILFVDLSESLFHIFAFFLGIASYWYFNFLNSLLISKSSGKTEYNYKQFFVVINVFFSAAFAYNLFSFLKVPVWMVLPVFLVCILFFPWKYQVYLKDSGSLPTLGGERKFSVYIWPQIQEIRVLKTFFIISSIELFVVFLFLPFSALSVAGSVTLISYFSTYILFADIAGFLTQKLVKLYLGISIAFIAIFILFIF